MLQFVAAKLAQPGPRQRVHRHLQPARAVVAGQCTAGRLHRTDQPLAQGLALVGPQQGRLRDRHADQSPAGLQHANLTHPLSLAQYALHPFRIDILAAGQDDHGGTPALEVKVAVAVQLSQIAGAEPAVLLQHLAGLVGTAPVAVEDVIAPGQYLTDLPGGSMANSTPGRAIPALSTRSRSGGL